jgi:2'-5' RNA ligase
MDRPVQRLFIALPLDETTQSTLHEAATDADLPALRTTPPHNLHLTLRFLGETPADAIADLVAMLGGWTRELSPFDLRTTGRLMLFPGERRPRILAAEIEPDPKLMHLAERVERACQEAGFPAEQRPFRPHITLGRFKFKGRPPRGFAPPEPNAPTTSTHVTEAVLYASDLTPDGAVHRGVQTLPLTGVQAPPGDAEPPT